MRNLGVHFSSKSDEWITPDDLFQQLREEFRFTLDPCATGGNARCTRYYTNAEDGLAQDWGTDVVFMNPPYSDIARWIEKAHASALAGATVVCLIPARTDRPWWGDYVLNADEIWFIAGRVRFVSPDEKKASSAPFPSVVVVFRPMSSGHPFVGVLKQRRAPRVRGKPRGGSLADPIAVAVPEHADG